MRTKKHCNYKTDIPTTEHYAIIEFSTMHIPGDQRSIDCPGHGYPATTESVSKYISYIDRLEWEQDIAERLTSKYSSDKDNFVALKVAPATVETKFTVLVK